MLTVKTKQGIFFAVAILCAASCFTVRFPALAQDSNSTRFLVLAHDPDATTSKLTSLLEERRDLLKQRVEAVANLVGIARSTHEALIAARYDLLEAEFELAVDSNQRIAVLQRKLDNAEQFESLMRKRKEDAKGTEVEVLAAKAGRLGVEIELLRETERKGTSQ
jgi:hypothetical protein